MIYTHLSLYVYIHIYIYIYIYLYMPRGEVSSSSVIHSPSVIHSGAPPGLGASGARVSTLCNVVQLILLIT